jgi:hypothetical protein
MSDGPREMPAPRDHEAQAQGFLGQVAVALAGNGITATLSAEGGFPALEVTGPHSAGRDAAALAIDSDSLIECTWTPPEGTDARATAQMITAVLNAIHPGQQ